MSKVEVQLNVTFVRLQTNSREYVYYVGFLYLLPCKSSCCKEKSQLDETWVNFIHYHCGVELLNACASHKVTTQEMQRKIKIHFHKFDNIPLFCPIKVSKTSNTQATIFVTRLDAAYNHSAQEQLNWTYLWYKLGHTPKEELHMWVLRMMQEQLLQLIGASI